MIIDNKGKIFGKVNIIDAFVLIILTIAVNVSFKITPILWRGTFGQSTEMITLRKNEYEEQREEYRKQQEKLIQELKELRIFKIKLNNFLKEHKKLRIYFEKE